MMQSTFKKKHECENKEKQNIYQQYFPQNPVYNDPEILC